MCSFHDSNFFSKKCPLCAKKLFFFKEYPKTKLWFCRDCDLIIKQNTIFFDTKEDLYVKPDMSLKSCRKRFERLSRLINILVNQGLQFSKKRILDFGAGLGELETVLQKFGFKNYSYFCTEINPRYIETLKKKNLKIINFYRSKLKFDYIFLVQSVQYFDNLLLLRQLFSFLKKHGILIIEVLNPFSYYHYIADLLHLDHCLRIPSNMYLFPLSETTFYKILNLSSDKIAIKLIKGAESELINMNSKLLKSLGKIFYPCFLRFIKKHVHNNLFLIFKK